MTYNIQDVLAAAAEVSADQTVASKGGGGEYVPPAEGACGLRFVSYIELGKHEGEYQGKPKISDQVKLTFEVSGPKWEPKVLEDGTKIPVRITISLNKSTNEKAGYFKLLKAMNWEGKAKIMAQLLGNDFVGRIHHRKFTRSDKSEGVSAQLRNPDSGAFTIGAPFVEDLDTGESKRRNVPLPLTDLKLFLWDMPSKAMWDSIHIEGEYEEQKDEKTGKVTRESRSKNVFQDTIRAAKNFKGSPIDVVLQGEVDDTVTETKTPAQVKAERDAAAAAKKARAEKEAAAKAEAAKLADAKTASAGADDSVPADDEDPLSAF